MSSRPGPPTYRLRRIPADVKLSQLPRFLTESIKSFRDCGSIQVRSLAPSLEEWSRSRTQVATVDFGKVPKSLQDGRSEWAFTVSGLPMPLLLDTHFLDFTPLNEIPVDEHEFDCIAISGLASHPFGSWKQRDHLEPSEELRTNFMWLRDQLPHDIRCMRIMTYGYDSRLAGSQSFQSIDDIALSLIRRLQAIRPAGRSSHPIIFLAHSLGGIVLKSGLLHLAGSGDAELSLLNNVRAVIFFGVPNKGMHVSHLLSMVESQPNEDFVRNLSCGSSYLNELDENFSGIAEYHDIRIVSAFETELSPTAVKLPSGKFVRQGKSEILVGRESAIQTGSKDTDIFPINKNHSEMVKFSDSDHTYVLVRTFLDQITTLPKVTVTDHGSNFQQRKKGLCNGAGMMSLGKLGRNQSSHGVSSNFNFLGNLGVIPVESEAEAIKGMLQSLQFHEHDYRLKQIEIAHSGTFDWVLGKDELGFVEWLRHGFGLYWIRGKPGSGKSCLMKFLHDSKQCSKILSQWQPQRTLVKAWFFFHERGSALQKSWEGLLQSIIWQIVSAEPELGRDLLSVYRSRSATTGNQWTSAELDKLFATILGQKRLPIDIILFLDALDEYNDPPELIADVLQDLGRRSEVHGTQHDRYDRSLGTRIKVCFSSRPWDVFVRRFNTCPGFSIHDHTIGDMRTYVVDRLLEAENLEVMRQSENWNREKQEVADNITTRAEGVFLWVKLVMNTIAENKDLTSKATMEGLEVIISEVPDKLEDVYFQTLLRISNQLRYETFNILEIVYRSPEVLYVDELYFASGCGSWTTYADCVRELQRRRSQKMTYSNMATHLKNLCGGLIEILHITERPKVQFIHRTVKDFVGKPGSRERILGTYDQPASVNGFSTLLKYYVVHLHNDLDLRAVSTKGEFDKISHDTMRIFGRAIISGQHAESTTGTHQGTFLDSVPSDVFERMQTKLQKVTGCDSVMAFAVIAGLRLYTLAKLESRRLSCASAEYDSHIPLLHSPVIWALFHIYLFARRPDGALLASMIDLLLINGEDPGVLYNGLTAFETLFSHGLRGHVARDLDMAQRAAIGQLAEVFLLAGQNPNIWLKVGYTAQVDPNVMSVLRESTSKTRTTPLHVSRSPLTDVLIQYGAKVNTVDEWGYSPLDICIGGLLHVPLDERTPEEVVTTTAFLLKHGGCITERGQQACSELVRYLETHQIRLARYSSWKIPENFRCPPHMHQGTPCISNPSCPLNSRKSSVSSKTELGQETPAVASKMDVPVLTTPRQDCESPLTGRRKGVRGYLSKLTPSSKKPSADPQRRV